MLTIDENREPTGNGQETMTCFLKNYTCVHKIQKNK